MVIEQLKIISIDDNKWLPNTSEDILIAEKVEVEEVSDGIEFIKRNDDALNKEECYKLIFKNKATKDCFVQLRSEGQKKHYKILKVETRSDYFQGTIIKLILENWSLKCIDLLSQGTK